MHNDRRHFLKTAALAALSRGRILGANDRIRLGGIGLGTRGGQVLPIFRNAGNADIVALSDPYAPRIAALKQQLGAADAREYPDFRQLLDQKDIDAVLITAPDHWHAAMAIAALDAGKDVYLEKPVSHTIEEGERLLAAAAASPQIIQAGYQQRSWAHFKQARDIVASGALGRICAVFCSWASDYISPAVSAPQVNTDQLNWKAFLGPAPDQPYRLLRFWRWRFFWDFGGGHLTDLFSHLVDVVHWYLGQDTPSAATAIGGQNVVPEFECPDTLSAAFEYPGFTVTHNATLVGTLEGINITFRGTDGMMKLNRDGFTVYQERAPIVGSTGLPAPLISARSTGEGTVDHVNNFLDCVRSRQTPNADIRSAVAAARAAHLGNQAYRTASRVTL